MSMCHNYWAVCCDCWSPHALEPVQTARRTNQPILKEISPEYSLEGLMLKLKLQYFGHLIQRTDSLENTLILGKNWRQEEKGTTENEMAGWHHWLNGHEFEWTPGVGDGQGGLACCSAWGCKESDMTELLNWTKLKANHFHWKRTVTFPAKHFHWIINSIREGKRMNNLLRNGHDTTIKSEA